MDAVTRAKSATEGGGGMELEEMKGRPESDIEWYVERAQDPESRRFVEVLISLMRNLKRWRRFVSGSH